MKRKILVIAGLLGISLVGGFNRPALAIPFCSTSYCSSVSPGTYCACPPGTAAWEQYGSNFWTQCDSSNTWQVTCDYV